MKGDPALKISVTFACLSAALAAPAAVAAQPFGFLAERKAEERPAMLIVGTPHFGNPGADILNQKIEDVLAPRRQQEIEALVERLAAFRPTRVAVEWGIGGQDRLDKRYVDYRAGRYALSRNEIDQIGLRLAARLGLDRVDAVDWNEDPPGEEKDYDFFAYMEAHGTKGEFEARRAVQQAEMDAESAEMRCTSVSDWLRGLNSAAYRDESHQPYYDYAMIGDAVAYPGATWVGHWYARNLRIFANLVRLAGKPEDRVLVIYGAGHGFLLDQFARESGAFTLADPLEYLPEGRRDPACR
jgi:hypothetical protein